MRTDPRFLLIAIVIALLLLLAWAIGLEEQNPQF